MSTTAALSVGSTRAFMRLFPHNSFSLGQLKNGCRVSVEDAATVSRCGIDGFLFTPRSPEYKIRSRNSSCASRSADDLRHSQPQRSPLSNITCSTDCPTFGKKNQVEQMMDCQRRSGVYTRVGRQARIQAQLRTCSANVEASQACSAESMSEVGSSEEQIPADEADEELLSEFKNLLESETRPGLHVIHIAAEIAPAAKVGGLGDVLTGLSRSLQKKGHLVETILPKYDCMDYSRIINLKELDMELLSFYDGQMHKNKVWSGIVEGVPVYFIESLHADRFFCRGEYYAEPDDFRRFTYFSRAAMEFILQSGRRPDIIHTHDWQTAVVAPLYWDVYVPLGLDSAKLAFTCHNFQYQGAEDSEAIGACGLAVQDLMRPDRMQDDSSDNKINLVKGAIVYSNVVTTVSPTYAQEVLQPEYGRGLHGTLGAHSEKFYGILNGIDVEVWDPATDTLLDHQYSVNDVRGKFLNKQKLRERLGLGNQGDDERRPLVGCVTRLAPQKGVHLLKHAISRTLEKGGQFILLGSSNLPDVQQEFEIIARQFENHPQIRLVLKYDEALSHAIYSAADIFVIPSIFEPCGLTQMISMRYGTIPVVRRTGGLADSVFDVDDETIPEEKKNGFVFDDANEESFNSALDRALDYYAQRPEWWQDLVKKAMLVDSSWDFSADRYVDLYRNILSNTSAAKS